MYPLPDGRDHPVPETPRLFSLQLTVLTPTAVPNVQECSPPTTGMFLKAARRVGKRVSLTHSHRSMFGGIRVSPRSRRRQTSRLDCELDDRERQRRVPVSNSALAVQRWTLLIFRFG